MDSKNCTNELIQKTEKESQMQKTNFWLPKRKRRGEIFKKKGGGLPVGPVTKIHCCQCREINAEKFHVSFTQCLPLATSCKTILQL